MKAQLTHAALSQAAAEGMDSFLQLVAEAVKKSVGGELNAEALEQLTPEQVTLWAYLLLREELMDGGFVQLIYNGYGPFFFKNPFAKAMRQWDLPELAKLINKAKKLYYEKADDLTRERTDEEFMALFEQNPEFDALDDAFVEDEEVFTASVAHYVDEHLAAFVEITE